MTRSRHRWNKTNLRGVSLGYSAVAPCLSSGSSIRDANIVLRKNPGDASMNMKSVASSVFTVAACILCMGLVMGPTVVSGASMMPTLHEKDVLITSPLAKRLFEPTRGDIVIVCLSSNPLCGFVFSGDRQYVKRVVAIPGDVVRYSTCNIFVTTATGQQIEDTAPTMACHDAGGFKRIVLPNGMYFVAGDNRGNSLDSRIFGPVDKSQIHAKVLAQLRLTR